MSFLSASFNHSRFNHLTSSIVQPEQNRRVAQEAQRPVRVAVIGTGSLGQHHARIYAEMAAAGTVEFTGIFDANAEVARSFAEKYGTRAFTSIDEAAASSEALNIVTPTVTHFPIASQLL